MNEQNEDRLKRMAEEFEQNQNAVPAQAIRNALREISSLRQALIDVDIALSDARHYLRRYLE